MLISMVNSGTFICNTELLATSNEVYMYLLGDAVSRSAWLDMLLEGWMVSSYRPAAIHYHSYFRRDSALQRSARFVVHQDIRNELPHP